MADPGDEQSIDLEQTQEEIFEGIHKVQELVDETKRLVRDPKPEPPAIADPPTLVDPNNPLPRPPSG